MDRTFYDEQDLGNERSSGSSSSRRGKRSSNNSGKPKQPQRGLGVAQLEKIRLHNELGYNTYLPAHPSSLHHAPNYQEDMGFQGAYSSVPSSSSFSYTSSSSFGHHGQQNFMIGFGEPDSSNIGKIERWNPNIGIVEAQHFVPPPTTQHFLHHQVEDQKRKKRDKGRSVGSNGSGSQNSDTSDTQELDLELRLSLYPP